MSTNKKPFCGQETCCSAESWALARVRPILHHIYYTNGSYCVWVIELCLSRRGWWHRSSVPHPSIHYQTGEIWLIGAPAWEVQNIWPQKPVNLLLSWLYSDQMCRSHVYVCFKSLFLSVFPPRLLDPRRWWTVVRLRRCYSISTLSLSTSWLCLLCTQTRQAKLSEDQKQPVSKFSTYRHA